MQSVQKLILLVLVVIPFMELYFLIQVGGFMGVFPTILLVMFTAILGAGLVRKQGFATWQRLQANMAQGIMPAYELIEGMLLLLGGLLLLTPGFITDALGFMCLVPAWRHQFARTIMENHLFSVMPGSPFQAPHKPEPDAIEGEFKRDDK